MSRSVRRDLLIAAITFIATPTKDGLRELFLLEPA